MGCSWMKGSCHMFVIFLREGKKGGRKRASTRAAITAYRTDQAPGVGLRVCCKGPRLGFNAA